MRSSLLYLELLSCILLCLGENDYWQQRQDLIDLERSYEVGASIKLDQKETKVNELLMNLKLAELDEGYSDPGKYLPAQHFFNTRHAIKANPIYKFLRAMPKGTLLHTHDTATVSWEFLYEQTYLDDLYLCNDTDQLQRLKFFQKPSDDCRWQLVKDLRASYEDFEEWLVRRTTLIREQHEEEFSHINEVWSTFQNIFIFVTDMITYKPVFEKHYWQTLKELHQDGIMYLEFRGTLPPIYDLDGRTYTPEEVIEIYKNLTEKFTNEHPDFLGARFIYAPLRQVDNETADTYFEIAENLLKHHSDFVAGFDLVGQEDLGRPLIDFVDKLKEFDAKFFFHAGETNWHHAPTDINLLDAILLGTERIGHGYALIKHPELMKIVKERKIALEISPISNQVLLLVNDMRNHPGASYLADGLPVVITNDDPTYWGAEGVSYDWYMMFMGFASRNADLRLLKQLAINSIQYCSLNEEAKQGAMKMWSSQWDNFIDELLAGNVSRVNVNAN